VAIAMLGVGIVGPSGVAHGASIWTPVASGTTDDITAIEYQADDRFWLATGNGKILKLVGGTFQTKFSSPGVVFNDIEFQPAPGLVGLAVGNSGAVYRSANGGDTWTAVTGIPVANVGCSAAAPLGDVQKVAFASDSRAYLFGARHQVARSAGTAATVGGTGTWADVNGTPGGCRLDSSDDITGAFFVPGSSPVKGYFMGRSFGEMFYTADDFAGTLSHRPAFTPVNGFQQVHRLAGDASNPNRQWGITPNGPSGSYQGRTPDGWASYTGWTVGNPDHGGDFQPLWDIAASGGTVLSAGESGDIAHSTDGISFFHDPADGALASTGWRSVALASASKGAVGGVGGALAVTDRANVLPDSTPPTATISGPATATVGTPVTFTAVASDNVGGSGIDPAGFAWSSTGLPGASGATATFTFPVTGVFSVQLNYRDLAGNAGAAASKTVEVKAAPKPTPTLAGGSKPPLTGGVARVSKGFVVLRISGKLTPPSGVSRAKACKGTLTLTVLKAKRALVTRLATLSKTCRYTKTIRIAKRRVGRSTKLLLRVRFGGNSVLGTRAKTYTVKVRR
jgi:hypothetical protein